MPSHITYYNQMPIPPLEAQTEFVDAGPLRFGIEYRLLSEAVTAASNIAAASGTDKGDGALDDRGVSLHVYGVRDGEALEHLRFDCFDEDPHYHYISWTDRSNVMLHLDPIADGDALQWTLERLRTPPAPDAGERRRRGHRRHPRPAQRRRRPPPRHRGRLPLPLPPRRQRHPRRRPQAGVGVGGGAKAYYTDTTVSVSPAARAFM